MAAAKLNAPQESLTVSRGVVTAAGTPPRSVTYGELVGGKLFNVLSPDGKYVAYTSTRYKGSSIYLIDVASVLKQLQARK